MNDELRAMLKLLSQFNNPKALHKTQDLERMYSELLANKQTDVQVSVFFGRICFVILARN